MLFSIIIPVKSINNYVRETVPHIQALTDHKWELFIIPNSIEENEWADDKRITLLESGKVGPAQKRDLGAISSNGDIVVDNLIHPSKVLGVAAGDGTMKKQFSTEDLNKITKFSKKFM